MFDFQKLLVYKKSKHYCKQVTELLITSKFDKTKNDQFRRASFSIMLNIAEGSSRFSNKERRRFLEIARGSAFECAAILDYLNDHQQVSTEKYNSHFNALEEISKMLFGLMRKLET